MTLARHLLADLSRLDRAALADRAVAGLLPPYAGCAARVRACLAASPLPGIVARPTLPLAPGEVQLGLAFPFREGETRVKSAIAVAESEIAGFTDPFEVARRADALAGPLGDLLRGLAACAAARGLRFGVIGSAALEIVTGLPYTSARSDLDVIVAGGDAEAFAAFAADAEARARAAGVRVDAEVTLADGGGVKLAELVSPSSSLVVKHVSDVRLAARAEVLAAL